MSNDCPYCEIRIEIICNRKDKEIEVHKCSKCGFVKIHANTTRVQIDEYYNFTKEMKSK